MEWSYFVGELIRRYSIILGIRKYSLYKDKEGSRKILKFQTFSKAPVCASMQYVYTHACMCVCVGVNMYISVNAVLQVGGYAHWI